MSQLLLIPVLAAQLLITLSPRLEVLPLAGVGFPPLTYVPASVDVVDAVVVDSRVRSSVSDRPSPHYFIKRGEV